MLKVVEKSWNDFWAYYWRVTDRHRIPQIFDWDKKLVNFIEHVCEISSDDRILDLGCGGGDQAKVFAQKGYEVVGIDIAPSLIDFAKNQFNTAGLRGTFIVGDMRSIDYDNEFNLVVILSGSFGFFDHEENKKLLCSIKRSLKPEGKTFIMYVNRQQAKKRTRSWREIDDGWELNETWFDNETNTYQGTVLIIRKDGTILKPKSEPGYHANEVIRCYTVPEIKALLKYAGLRYIASYSSGDLSVPAKAPPPDIERNIVVAERAG